MTLELKTPKAAWMGRAFAGWSKRAATFALFAAAGLGRLAGQGGPPMVTDDPGTPGNNKWEINVAWTVQRTPGLTEIELPQIDANYGIGDRIQLNYQSQWEINNGDDGSNAGLADAQLAVKWRYYDAGEHGWQASIYPRFTFLTPGTNSDERGLADDSKQFLMPFEVCRDFGAFTLGFECGRIFSTRSSEDGWIGGIVLGREITKGWELDFETHLNASSCLGRTECLVNLGSRIDFSEHVTLLLAIGRDTSDRLGPVTTLLTYTGLQFRF